MLGLKVGSELKTADFKSVVIENVLGEGGQGIVYKVNYNGQPKALKWYFVKKLREPEKFKANLLNNIEKGKPNDSFLWPQDLITHPEGTEAGFGYIMEFET